MNYKCSICGSNDVERDGDICELCAIAQDPYHKDTTNNIGTSIKHRPTLIISGDENNNLSPKQKNRKILLNGGSEIKNQDPYGNVIPQNQPVNNVQVYSSGQVSQQKTKSNVGKVIRTNVKNYSKNNSKNTPITSGVTKNISTDCPKKSILGKWFRSLFNGAPFSLDNDITMFQVFPDFSGSSLNAMGNACDQVVVYGKVNNGAISENNDVEVYGRRDSKNNIIAQTIRNKASGTIVTPSRAISATVVRVITLFLSLIVASVVATLGIEAMIWVAAILICLTNLPLVFKILGIVIGAIFSFFKRI